MFCGLTAVFWAELRGDDAVRRALGTGLVVNDVEAEGLERVREVRQRSPEAKELLAFDGVVAVCLTSLLGGVENVLNWNLYFKGDYKFFGGV